MVVMMVCVYIVFLILTIQPTVSYKVGVILEDEGVLEELEFEITNTQNSPFETNSDSSDEGLEEFIWGPVVTGNLGNRRGKRSVVDAEVCMRSGGKKEEEAGRNLVVEQGEEFHLPCHSCGDGDSAKFESLQWIKLSPLPNSKGLYHLKEILSGMHEDDKRNRIVITVDHRLTIKRARNGDSGNYFCTRGITKIVNKWLSWADLQKWIKENVHLKFFFHVDVLKLINKKIVDVSEYSGAKPRQTEPLPVVNIAMETNWHPWGECNVCGQEGLRKRVGICMVKKLDKYSPIPNNYLDNVLRSAEKRLPCESQLLRQFADEGVLNRPNEVQSEACLVPCEASNIDRKRRSISKSEILTGEKKSESKSKSKEKSVTDGDYLILVCPGSSITSNPVWVNGTENIPLMQLRKQTSSRIRFDPLGNLIFAPVTLADTGTFSCWVKGKIRRKFKVKVKVNTAEEAVEYGVYMCYVFFADLGVFVFLSVVKFMNRKVQVRRKRKKETKVEDPSDDEAGGLVNETNGSTSS